MSDYQSFLARKSQLGSMGGFEPVWMPPFLFDFQKALVDWSVRKGRAALFADCGLGKTPMQLVWAQNVVEKTNRPVLILTPLAVSFQTVEEAKKFGMTAARSTDGSVPAKIVVTNYERADRFNPNDFAGIVCDESSILKNFDGSRRATITELMRTREYRLLCTATAAPNDYVELGTSSEALGELGHMDMLGRFFRNVDNTASHRIQQRSGRDAGQRIWRFKGHAELHFWRWVASWARAVRRPSDIGFADDGFVLPSLTEREHVAEARTKRDGMLIDLPAVGLEEQREERRRTVQERCEMVAALVSAQQNQSLVWCHLNDEGDTLADAIPGSVQVSGSDDDDEKEAKLFDFAHGNIQRLVTKPKIGAWGLNFQRCSHMTFFPSHSYEQYYQGVRRCWRFGQKLPVHVDIISTEGEKDVLKNLQRKAAQADKMFSALVGEMTAALTINRSTYTAKTIEAPSWLAA